MENEVKQKLIGLGPEALADALLNLALHADVAEDLVDRLIASPEENIRRFKKKLASLKRSRRFIRWGASSGFARELQILLQDLEGSVTDPLIGAELVAAFYKADEGILGNCDDSSGYVGDVFRYDAKELFLKYASQCEDKKKIAEIILKLNRKDDYGIRDSLINCAGACLPEPLIRTMIATLQKLSDKENDEYAKRHHLMLIESLARQIKDAKLFEATRIASWGKLSAAACVDIARVYLESDEVEMAHSWLKKVPENDTFQSCERDQLLLEIYRKQGDNEKLTDLLYQNFNLHHSVDTLDSLLAVVGDNKREEIVDKEVKIILEDSELCDFDAEFLIALGKIDEAEKYLIDRADQLDGENYYTYPSLADEMLQENRYLVVTLIYRSLLNSILKRGYTKAYSHGVRYLNKLDELSAVVNDWKHFDNHQIYKDQIFQAHRLKKSFWSKYEA